MKIAYVETFDLRCNIEPSFGWSQGWIDQRATTLVKITTEDGLVGWGEGAAASLIDELLAPIVIGGDPMQRAGLWERMFHALYNANIFVGLAGSALSAIDIALWDLAGKATGLPAHALLGGKVRNRVAVYATGLYYTEGEFPNRLLDEARSYVEQGFTGIKTKVGGLTVEKDVRRVRAPPERLRRVRRRRFHRERILLRLRRRQRDNAGAHAINSDKGLIGLRFPITRRDHS